MTQNTASQDTSNPAQIDSVIPKIDYTKVAHPSGVKALSLKDAPALIETLFPVQRLSMDVYKERSAGSGQTLTALGSYWKGRKPLVLNRACILAALLPATNQPLKDLEVFEMLMGMDDISLSKRIGLPKPAEIVRNTAIWDVKTYFDVVPEEAAPAIPQHGPFELESHLFADEDGKEVVPRLRWKPEITEEQKHQIVGLASSYHSYKSVVSNAKRAEEIGDNLVSHVWSKVNSHLGTAAQSFPELVEQLGVMRYGHRPTMADTFSGSGQIPFAAAQLGCDVYASDLNPVACMLTWGAFNIVGASPERRTVIEAEQKALVARVKAEIDALGIESDGNGWRGKVYLYCLEVTCPSSGWKVPVLPTLVVSKGKSVYAKLIPDEDMRRYDIELVCGATPEEMKRAEIGTYRKGNVVHVVDGVEHSNSISSIRGDYTEVFNAKKVTKNRLRQWEKSDVVFRDDDIYNERLYAIQWIQEQADGSRARTEFRSVTAEDLGRERHVNGYVQAHLAEWQDKGWVPDTRIEPGDKTDEPIRTRGWTHWHQLFNPRQLLVFSFLKRSCESYTSVYLLHALNWSARLSTWNNHAGAEKPQQVFINQALNTIFNYGARSSAMVLPMLSRPGKTFPISIANSVISNQSNPVSNFPGVVDIFITDPPYGDAVKYEEILEFFIAWMRKNPPKEFASWTWDSRRELAVKGEGHDFRLGMIAAYKRMTECMPDNGLQIMMFTHQDEAIWADMANIVWASGLRVTAAWYLVTETDSALREGSYVKGTILLVLRKRLGSEETSRDELAYEIEDEVIKQVDLLTGLTTSSKGLYRDDNLFDDADIQMAGFAAALRVLTKYETIDGTSMPEEALRPRVKGKTTMVDSLISFAVGKANEQLRPSKVDKDMWAKLIPEERFYMKALDSESRGMKTLSNYQNFSKAFKVSDYDRFLRDARANEAELKTAFDFGRQDMSDKDAFGSSKLRAVLYGMHLLKQGKDGEEVVGQIKHLRPDYFSERKALATLAGSIVSMSPESSDSVRYARMFSDLLTNDSV